MSPRRRRGRRAIRGQSGPAADNADVSDHRKSVMGDPVDPVERGEIELALRTDRVDVIDSAPSPVRASIKPIGQSDGQGANTTKA